MAAIPKFSFSGWTSQSLVPKVNPATVPIATTGLVAPGTMVARENLTAAQLQARSVAAGASKLEGIYPGGTGQLIGQTNAANTNLPAWLQAEVDRLNAQDALRTQLAGQVTGGGGPAAPAFDPNLGVAAVTNARANYNAQINQVNEQARLQSLIQQRNQIRPQGFGFTNPFDVNRLIGLGNQIQDYQNVNLPLASNAVSGIRRNASGWVQPMWA